MGQTNSITSLRRQMAVLEDGKKERRTPLTFGVEDIDTAINGGLVAGRMHEVNGLAAWSLAIVLAGRAGGPVLWCERTGAGGTGRACHFGHRLYPPGCVPLGLQPQHLLMVECRNQVDALWASEEALRSGAVRMVVLESTEAVDLTAARRLQLAAEAGGGLGLMTGMGPGPVFPAAASRWRAEPDLEGCISLQLTRNRAGTDGQWMVKWNETARHLSVVSSPCRRTGNAVVAQCAR